MSCYSKLLKNSTEYNELLKAINADLLPSGVTGLPPSPKAHLIHSLCEDTSRRALVILPNEATASRLVNDINEFSGNGKKPTFTLQEIIRSTPQRVNQENLNKQELKRFAKL